MTDQVIHYRFSVKLLFITAFCVSYEQKTSSTFASELK